MESGSPGLPQDPSQCIPRRGPLGTLLPELVESISEHLDQLSLHELALTNRHLASATAPTRFSRVRFYISDGEQLHEDIARMETIIKDRKRHVRTLEFLGPRTEPQWRTEDSLLGDSDDESCAVRDDRWKPPGSWRKAVEPLWCTKEGDAWERMASFVSSLATMLLDAIWACFEPIPHCVLLALEENCKIRLHVHSFSFRSLYPDLDRTTSTPQYDETPLERSPCLYSVVGPHKFRCVPVLPGDLRTLLSKLAPQVRHVCFWEEGISIPEPWGPPWNQFRTPRRSKPAKDVALLSLKVPEVWITCFSPAELDLSSVTSLTLYNNAPMSLAIDHDRVRLDRLIAIADMKGFQALRELACDGSFHEWDEDTLMLEHFFSALPPLETLSVSLGGKNLFTTIMQHHGRSLRCLVLLRMTLTLSDLHHLGRACPQIYKLRVGLQRTEGDETEVQAYQSLGAMPTLKYLTLDLYCFHPTIQEGLSHRAATARANEATVGRVLRNAAMDETLARAICDTILKAGDQEHPALRQVVIGMASPVEILRCDLMGNHYESKGLFQVVSMIGQSWRFRRGLWGSNEPSVTGIRLRRSDQELSEIYLQEQSRYKPVKRPEKEYYQSWVKVGLEIWPGEWRFWDRNWKSFPLAKVDRTAG